VKLLFDENLSPRLPELLAAFFPESAHVHSCGLASADDTAIWNFAKSNGFSIVSKDSDFAEMSVLLGSPPKVIWLRVNNCTSSEIETLLRNAHTLITQFIAHDQETCLVLGPKFADP